MMQFLLRVVTVLCWWTMVVTVGTTQPPPELAGDKFQNVTSLKEMPADQMGKVMNIMSEALGVNCTYCHAGYDFAKEGVAHKSEARRMIEMTLALNRDYFAGRTVITCMTCHQGKADLPKAHVSATAVLAAVAAKPAISATSAIINSIDQGTGQPPDPNQSLGALMNRFPQLVGRQPAENTGTQKNPLTNEWQPLHFHGKRLEPGGKSESETMHLSAPGVWQQVTLYGQLAVTESFANGAIEKRAGKQRIELKPEEAAQIKIEAHLALGLGLQSQFTDWAIDAPVTIDDHPMLVLRARDAAMVHHFFFDTQSSWLRRRTTTVPTVLGAYVIEVDYQEYQEMAGRHIAALTSFRMPSVRWQRKIESVAKP